MSEITDYTDMPESGLIAEAEKFSDAIFDIEETIEDQETLSDDLPTYDNTDEEGDPSDDEGDNDESVEHEETPPNVDMPKSWKAELKDEWNKLSEDAKRYIADTEAKKSDDLSKQFGEVKEQKSKLEMERQKAIQERSQYVQALGQQKNIAEHELTKKYGSINFVELAQNNPAEYVRLQAEYTSDVGYYQQLAQNLNQVQEVIKADNANLAKNFISEQVKKLQEYKPEWQEKETFVKETTEVRNYLGKQYGYSNEELNHLVDSREAIIAHKAMLYDQMVSKKSNATKELESKKVVGKPQQTLKPQSSSVSSKEVSDRKFDNKARNAVRNTNSTRNQAAILARLLD